MYQNDDTLTSRQRIPDEMLQKMLGLDAREQMGPPCAPDRPSLRLPDGFPLASVYAPIQVFRNLYDLDTALSRGTVFKELDLPFLGQTIAKGGTCRG